MSGAEGVDVAVIGGGVVGCAVAMRLARRGKSVLVLEAEDDVARGTTSRNSGVIHSGLYDAPGSLKARMCVRGQELLYAWLAQHPAWHRRCGKLVVAPSPAALHALESLHANATACGARDLELLTPARAAGLEPHLPPVAGALWCPWTGVVDPVEFTRTLVADAVAHGALVLAHARVTLLERVAGGWTLESTRGPVTAQHVVNAAGLHADHVARMAGVDRYRIHPCRGDYFRWRTPLPWQRLIYPVKDPASPGLGVHLTLDRGPGVRLGPDVEWVDARDALGGGQHKARAFAEAASRLLGHVRVEDLVHDGAGIRPKLRDRHGGKEKDFVVAEDAPGLVNLVGMESPGLTSALALAELVEARVADGIALPADAPA